MANSILITGGAASGKSRFAVTKFSAFDYVLYLRVGSELYSDVTNRIKFSTEKNGVEWDVVCNKSLSPADEIKDHKFVIFDDMALYTTNVMKDMLSNGGELNEDLKKHVEKRVIDEVAAMREKVAENNGSIIIITLETGFSVRPADPEQAMLREVMGRVNQRIANSCDVAYFSASGIQWKIR